MFWRGGELRGILKWRFPSFGWLPWQPGDCTGPATTSVL